eukprot:gene13063-biopygen467
MLWKSLPYGPGSRVGCAAAGADAATPQAPMQRRRRAPLKGENAGTMQSRMARRMCDTKSCRHSPPQTAANEPQATETCKNARRRRQKENNTARRRRRENTKSAPQAPKS